MESSYEQKEALILEALEKDIDPYIRFNYLKQLALVRKCAKLQKQITQLQSIVNEMATLKFQDMQADEQPDNEQFFKRQYRDRRKTELYDEAMNIVNKKNEAVIVYTEYK